MSRTRLDQFDATAGFDRGRSKSVVAVWYLLKCFFFLSPLPWPSGFKCFLLRLFGATIGAGVVIKPRVNIHFPWKLKIGDHSWIGEEVFLLNFELISIGSNCCLSQRAFLCAGNHDFREPSFSYRNAPIQVEDGCWVGAQSFVGPGVQLGAECVITAGSIVTCDQPTGMICSGNPCRPKAERWPKENHRD